MSVSRPAAAAESYDSCNNFIDSVPAVITTQGVWCLRKDLATANTNGNAISINANNVTIDCNDFKIGGLAAGNGSLATGIRSVDRQNVTVRNCNIRGFHGGIEIFGGAGHLVEDNRLDNNLNSGIWLDGDNTRVRRNAVYDTGGAIGSSTAWGISSKGNIEDNIVSGLFVDRSGATMRGINLDGRDSTARGNIISGFDMAARDGGTSGQPGGLFLYGEGQRASGNHVSMGGAISGWGIYSYYPNNFCLDNTVKGFGTNINNLCISTGNLTSP